MLTPTLFDVEAITGMNPLGKTFTPTAETGNGFVFECFSFKKFIIDHHDKKTQEVSDQENIAFLTLWLSYYVLYSGYFQIAKKYIPLEIHLHEGRNISLAKLILANLY